MNDLPRKKELSPKQLATVETELLTDFLVAQMLACSRTTVWSLVKQGAIRPIYVGARTTRFNRADVLAFAARGLTR
jgi:excisionase family DNA binding protein